ncbi:uncharacterized protein LOC141601772 [Silene latifolia]|uniref:uncharacterized protein LOC141601772 n=1 Tax=Silene latifolia TaxID=37657 RepID=UPI003D786873
MALLSGMVYCWIVIFYCFLVVSSIALRKPLPQEGHVITTLIKVPLEALSALEASKANIVIVRWRESVCNAIQDFFQSGKLLKQLNHTLITLVPKCALPQNVTQFRPISYCNVIYKCISKLLCSKLSEVLPDVISDNQGGFVKGRSIVENILICQDIVRLYNRKAISPRFLLKVDLKKAYDSISWEFLEQMLGALNFPEQFTALLMECVRSASYSLVLNGDIFGFFKWKKGLRQGDPLSPLMFTISMEYLSRVLAFITENMDFKFHPMCGKLKLSHLMFADDLLLFSKGDVESIMVLLRAFATFSKASGLQMSPSKTNAYFRGLPSWVKDDILLVSSFHEGELPFKYLGILITAGRLTKAQTQVLVGLDKGSKSSQILITAGRLRRNFFWDGKVELMRVPLVSWDKVCSPKEEGGLGIKDSSVWNIVALGKLVWWIYYSPDKLWVKWINQVYLNNESWNDYNPSGDVSWGWKNVCRAKDKLSPGYAHGQWSLDIRGYTVCSGCDLLRTRFQIVTWHKFIWHSWTVPKHRFLGWLMVREPMQVKEKLFALGICQDDQCLLCGNASETHNHLFVECVYSGRILIGMAKLYGISIPSRNRVHCEQVLLHPDIVLKQIQQVLKMRVDAVSNQILGTDKIWLSSIGLCK